MSLTDLPPELLEPIIQLSVPEGFESLALSCKDICALCRPYFKRHNRLRSVFHNFDYRGHNVPESCLYRRPTTAFDIIAFIAIEPVAARYIQTADFSVDSVSVYYQPKNWKSEAENVAKLLADSPYLAQAGLDWREYNADIIKEVTITGAKQVNNYSQRAAAFLLTLLPNVKTLRLPKKWTSSGAADKLIDTVVHGAKALRSPCDTPSLAQLTKFSPYRGHYAGEQGALALNSMGPFYALPHIKTFSGWACIATGDSGADTAPEYTQTGFGESLEHLTLEASRIDDIAIANFLKHASRLKTLRYSHTTEEGGDQDWDFCKFITVVERGVGHHLEELALGLRRPFRGSLDPGQMSMRGFPRLRKLEFPLDFVKCIIEDTDAGSRRTTWNGSTFVEDRTDLERRLRDLWMGALIPVSLSQLTLRSQGTDYHEEALDVLFRDFAARKEAHSPALSLAEISVECPSASAAVAYKDQCHKLVLEAEKAGVVVHVEERPKEAMWQLA